jgi:hypothetical protein
MQLHIHITHILNSSCYIIILYISLGFTSQMASQNVQVLPENNPSRRRNRSPTDWVPAYYTGDFTKPGFERCIHCNTHSCEVCSWYREQLRDKDATIRDCRQTIRDCQSRLLQKDATIRSLQLTTRVLRGDLDAGAAYDEDPRLDAQGRLTDRPGSSYYRTPIFWRTGPRYPNNR